MLPYPSGELHMGHVLNYTIGDVVVHLRRRRGYRVLRPMGYDAFGLPAENAAIRDGVHPRISTERNIAAIREQMRRMGWAIDWDREISTHDPDYYRWTQWLFLRFYERGLAYRKEGLVNWCPVDQTVLANEQVIDGHCERCGAEVEAKTLTQWYFKITDYADVLLDEMSTLEHWPERVLTMQRELDRPLGGHARHLPGRRIGREAPVFTTRPDTLFGATFFVLAPEHPLVPTLTDSERGASTYVRRCRRALGGRAREEGEGQRLHGRTRSIRERRGDPDLDHRLRAMGYGTGAIMAVPAHDERDHVFAEKSGLEIRLVVRPAERRVSRRARHSAVGTDDKVLLNSGGFSGMPSPEPKQAIVAWLAERGGAEATIGYRLRDWLLRAGALGRARSRSSTASGSGLVPVPDDQLPVVPPRSRTSAEGRSPVSAAEAGSMSTCPAPVVRQPRDGHDRHIRRLVLVLHPLTDPKNDKEPFSRQIADYWLRQPVTSAGSARDPHLLYARFFTR